MSDQKFPTNFYKATPEQKVEMLADGYRFIAAELLNISTNMSRLNRWLQVMPELIEKGHCNKPSTTELTELVLLLTDAADTMTPQIINQEECYEKLFLYLKSKEK